MKRIYISVVLLALVACGDSRSKQQTVEVSLEETAHKSEAYSSEERNAAFKNPEVAQVYDDYNLLKTALVNTDAEAAKNAAQVMLKNSEASTLELGFVKAIQAIADEDDVNIQREHFEAVTVGVKDLVEENIVSGTLYYQYCPMAFDGKGAYWISNEEKIYNPYFGDVMLNCGTVDAEIN
tara:strand:- start:30 stop:569 length:540 start_codon:yes stop_codon:yes gene_type:complete